MKYPLAGAFLLSTVHSALAAGASGCISHTRDDDAGPDPDGRVATPCDESTCLPSEYCEYPDGVLCGMDDSRGACRSRPGSCPEPRGTLVCGCDGNEYLGECAASLAGVGVASVGPCPMTTAYDTATASTDCDPWSGPAWLITLTTDRVSCDLLPDSILLHVWHAIDLDPPGIVYRLDIPDLDSSIDGRVFVCLRAGEACANAVGTVAFSEFVPGEIARFSYDINTADGRHFAASDVEIAGSWCRTTSLDCG